MSEFLDVLKVALPALVAGGSGVLVAAWRMRETHNQKLQVLTARIEALEKGASEVAKTKDDVQSIKTRFEVSEAATLLAQKDAPPKSSAAELKERIHLVEQRINNLAADVAREAAALSAFIKDQNSSWQKIHRLLGRMEGYASRAAKTWSDHPDE